ncbi:hypothetical protein SAMN05446037_101599 [Anaerovirgula multivorans]|uniref:Uncharacterized protein n=1 Tax=Anaerovirgula multivorans TaxID=312168 RepID=A0A239GAP5_9FIRM|nr:hypothetical protein SAMN05446037_101599 [Anaerovirgula multivorans]
MYIDTIGNIRDAGICFKIDIKVSQLKMKATF